MINIVKFEVNDNIKAVNRAAALYLELSSIYSYEIDFIKKRICEALAEDIPIPSDFNICTSNKT